MGGIKKWSRVTFWNSLSLQLYPSRSCAKDINKRLIPLVQTWRFNQSPDCSVCSSTQGALHTCKPKGRVTKMVTVGCGFQATICGGNKSNCVCSLPKPSVVETRHIPYGTTTKNKMCIKKNIKNELILEKAGPRVPSQRLGEETVWILDKPAVYHKAKLIFTHMDNLQLPCATLGLWLEAGAPVGNPRSGRKNMQSHTN